MIFFGLVQEQTNVDHDEVDWRPFIYGCVIGAVPWIAIAAQLIVSTTDGNGVPGFVVAIFITLFLLFNTFAVNMWLQYRGRGRWADPRSPSASTCSSASSPRAHSPERDSWRPGHRSARPRQVSTWSARSGRPPTRPSCAARHRGAVGWQW